MICGDYQKLALVGLGEVCKTWVALEMAYVIKEAGKVDFPVAGGELGAF